mmetsp:Transcript_67290/g.146659  ORF Transcript_67290/g.146659 Transcript_67290/m.146659 type:complete len:242 (-) Transcript_67290:43-768(-)
MQAGSEAGIICLQHVGAAVCAPIAPHRIKIHEVMTSHSQRTPSKISLRTGCFITGLWKTVHQTVHGLDNFIIHAIGHVRSRQSCLPRCAHHDLRGVGHILKDRCRTVLERFQVVEAVARYDRPCLGEHLKPNLFVRCEVMDVLRSWACRMRHASAVRVLSVAPTARCPLLPKDDQVIHIEGSSPMTVVSALGDVHTAVNTVMVLIDGGQHIRGERPGTTLLKRGVKLFVSVFILCEDETQI